MFGIVEVRAREGAGYRLQKYFLHQSQVVFQTMEQPREGDIVLFSIRPERRTLALGMLPSAMDAEIFETVEQMQAASEKGGEGSAA